MAGKKLSSSYIELQNLDQHSDNKFHKADTIANTLSSLNMAAVFGMFFSEETTRFLNNWGSLWMFPLFAAESIRVAIFAGRTMWKERTLASVFNFFLKSLSAIAITAAVVFCFFPILAALAAPIFAGALVAETLIYGSAALCYSLGALINPQHRKEYKSKAIDHGITAFNSSLGATAVMGAYIIGGPIFTLIGAIAGVVAGIMGVGMALSQLFKKPSKQPTSPQEPGLTGINTGDIYKQIGCTPHPSPSPAPIPPTLNSQINSPVVTPSSTPAILPTLCPLRRS